jgi:hypothetical protein
MPNQFDLPEPTGDENLDNFLKHYRDYTPKRPPVLYGLYLNGEFQGYAYEDVSKVEFQLAQAIARILRSVSRFSSRLAERLEVWDVKRVNETSLYLLVTSLPDGTTISRLYQIKPHVLEGDSNDE